MYSRRLDGEGLSGNQRRRQASLAKHRQVIAQSGGQGDPLQIGEPQTPSTPTGDPPPAPELEVREPDPSPTDHTPHNYD